MKPRSTYALLILAVGACSFIQFGCDGDNPASVPRNSQPVIEEIPDKALAAGTEATVQVKVIDSDVDDTHTISALSGDTGIATVSVDNTTLVIRGIAGGEVPITISATDDSGQDNAKSESMTFQVTVEHNSQPVIEEIPEVAVLAGTEATVQVNVIDSDVDDTHTISAISGDTGIATVSVSNTTLVIRGIAGGEVTITISATDDKGAESESITFQVTITEPPPPEPGKFSDFNGASSEDWRTMHENGQIVACREGLRLPRDSFCLDESFSFSSDYTRVNFRFLVAHLPDGDGYLRTANTTVSVGSGLHLGWISFERDGSEWVITHLDP